MTNIPQPTPGHSTPGGSVPDYCVRDLSERMQAEFVDFGTPGRWDQFSHELDGAYSPFDFQTAWDQFTPDQRSILAALSIDWAFRRFDTAEKLESNDPL